MRGQPDSVSNIDSGAVGAAVVGTSVTPVAGCAHPPRFQPSPAMVSRNQHNCEVVERGCSSTHQRTHLATTHLATHSVTCSTTSKDSIAQCNNPDEQEAKEGSVPWVKPDAEAASVSETSGVSESKGRSDRGLPFNAL